jgi:tetratricopeptide (TPR) repeat protein
MSRRKSTARQGPAEPARAIDALVQSSRLRKVGIAVICAYVAFVPLVFDPTSDSSFSLPKALLSHALAYVLAGVLAGMLVAFGRKAVRWSPLHVPVLAFLIVNAAATLVAEDRILALYGTHVRMLGLGSIAAWTLLYFAVVMLVRSRGDVVAIVVSGLGAAAVMLGYEALQALGRDPFSWDVDSATRPFSTNGQATTLAAYLTTLSVATLACAVAARALPRWVRGALLFSAIALLLGAAATGTRSALVGLVNGSAVLVGLVLLRHPSARARAIGLATAAFAAVALVGALTLTAVGARILQAGSSADDPDRLARLDLASLDVRGVLYQAAADAVIERPLLGYGPDNFVVAFPRHRPERGVDEARLAYATSPHSWVAQVAAGTGLIGLATFIAMIATAFVLVARSGFGALTAGSATAIAANLGTGLTSVNDVGSDWVLWVALALIAVATGTQAEVTGDVERSPRPSRHKGIKRGERVTRPATVMAATFVAAGVALAIATAPAFDASRAAWRSEELRLVGKVNDAVAAGLLATSRDSGRAEYWQRLGLAYVAAARWHDAARALERAVALAPWDVRYSSDLVQTQLILARDGDAAARLRAVQLVDDAVSRDPNYPAAHYTRAVVMQFIGNVAEAVSSIERALSLSPRTTNVQWYVVATQLYLATGRAEEGVRVGRAGFSVTGSPQIRIEYARALLASGRPQEALAEVDGMLVADPANAAAQRLRAEILAAIPR